MGNRSFRDVHYGSDRKRMLVLAFRANINVTIDEPALLMTASFADKAVRPFLLE